MDNPLASYLSLLALDPEDEVQYAFVKTVQNKLLSSDFMVQFESDLYKKMLDRFNSNVSQFNPEVMVLPIRTFEAAEITKERFQEIICQSSVEPFIVKNYLSNATALNKWSFEFFLEHYPDANVAYGWRAKDGSEIDGKFGKRKSICEKIKTPDDDRLFYINNTAQIFKDYPSLLSDLNFSGLKALYEPVAVGVILQLFMGAAKSGAKLHCANEFNSFLMVNGQKRWTFIPPEYSYALKGMLSVNALNAITEIDDHTRSFEYYEKHYPLYNRVPKYVSEIEAGDMLVFSPWWWHAIENISPMSIAVATRWTAIKRDCFPRGNIIYQNIQKANPLYQQYSKIFMNAVVAGELIGDEALSRAYFGKTEKDQ